MPATPQGPLESQSSPPPHQPVPSAPTEPSVTTLPTPSTATHRHHPQPATAATDGVRVRIPDTATTTATAVNGGSCVGGVTATAREGGDPTPRVASDPADHRASAGVAKPSPVPAVRRFSGPRAGDDIDPAARTPRSFHLSRQLLERARAAAHWVHQIAGDDEPTNVSELVERALRREVERLEQEYNDGQPFPAVKGRMRSGPGAAGVERIRRAQRLRRR